MRENENKKKTEETEIFSGDRPHEDSAFLLADHI